MLYFQYVMAILRAIFLGTSVYGPDGHLYGYMFTSWDHAVMRMVDEKTLFVNDIPMPPYLAIDKKGFEGDVRSR